MARKQSQPATAKPGLGERFQTCIRAVARRSGVRDPKALCAAIGRRKYGQEQFQQMAAAGRRRARRANPTEELDAAALSEQFHGRPTEHVTDLIAEQVERYALAELGRLIELVLIAPTGESVKLEFASRRPRLAVSPDGGQLYLEGGDQAVDLADLGWASTLPKDQVDLGQVAQITYRTSKAFHAFEPTDYVHQFGEQGGAMPRLGYDVLNERLYLIGGSYQVRPEGIID